MNNIGRFFQNIRFSFQGLGSNKMSSVLTLLGIIIGIGSVIGLMSLGQGTQDSIIGELEGLGTDILTITPGSNNFQMPDSNTHTGPSQDNFNQRLDEFNSQQENLAELTIEDYEFLEDENIDNIKQLSFTINSSQEVSFNELESESYKVVGTNPEFFSVYNLVTSSGELISQEDVESKNRGAVLGINVLSEYEREVGDIVNIGGIEFEIIGLLQEKEDSLLGSSPNSEIYIPYTVMDDLDVSSKKLSSIIVMVSDDSILEESISNIELSLMSFRGVEEKDFSIFSIQTLISTVQTITSTLTLLLSGIAAISLLVGGIGISNVMLITVTQRTREIGIRKAVGARRSDILTQFLTEAILLTLVGGIAGLGFGILIGKIAERFMGFSAVITVNSVVLAVGISVFIGILFGILPAIRASKLSPIEALRYE